MQVRNLHSNSLVSTFKGVNGTDPAGVFGRFGPLGNSCSSVVCRQPEIQELDLQYGV
jgi:hypothetical protein